jgi:hypothetical protein
MPVGTAIWSSGAVPDCKSVQLVQAMPWANGPDRYGTSHCADGDSITAITADGMQLWRRSLGPLAQLLPPQTVRTPLKQAG